MKYLSLILILSLAQTVQANPIEAFFEEVSALFKKRPKPNSKEHQCYMDGKKWNKETGTCVAENE